METQAENGGGQPDAAPHNFIVELEKGHYVVAERVTVLDVNSPLVSIDMIEDFLRRHPLRAAALPSGSLPFAPPHPNPPARSFQAGDAPLVNVNVFGGPSSDGQPG